MLEARCYKGIPDTPRCWGAYALISQALPPKENYLFLKETSNSELHSLASEEKKILRKAIKN